MTALYRGVAIAALLFAVTCIGESIKLKGIQECKDVQDSSTICSLLPNYNWQIPPPDVPIQLLNAMTFWQVNEVDDNKQTISFIVVMNWAWEDNRLQVKKNLSNFDTVTFTHLLDQLWIPDIIFTTAIKTETVGGMKGNALRALTYWHYNNTNKLLLEDVLRITSECKMDFANFPFDHQSCDWFMRSQHLHAKDLTLGRVEIFTDANNEIRFYSSNETALLHSSGISFDVKVSSIDPFNRDMRGHDISVTGIRFNLERKGEEVQRLLSSFFFPTGVFAILSLFSFSINPDIVPGRMGMLVTIFLIVTGIYNTVDAPRSRGFSFIELWYIGVQVPIIFAILQYGVILTFLKYMGPQKEINIMGELKSSESFLKTLDMLCLCMSLVFIVSFDSYFVLACFKAMNQ